MKGIKKDRQRGHPLDDSFYGEFQDGDKKKPQGFLDCILFDKCCK